MHVFVSGRKIARAEGALRIRPATRGEAQASNPARGERSPPANRSRRQALPSSAAYGDDHGDVGIGDIDVADQVEPAVFRRPRPSLNGLAGRDLNVLKSPQPIQRITSRAL